MSLVYATTADLTVWTGAALPTNATILLRSASRLVRDQTSMAFYPVDTNGVPTDAAMKQAFNDATCAQAAFWDANKIDPVTGGITTAAPVRARRIGTAGLDYDTSVVSSVTAYAAKAFAARTLCQESAQILQQAGLNLTNPWVVG